MQLEQDGLQKRQDNSENRLKELRQSDEQLSKQIEDKNLNISRINSSLSEAKRQEDDSLELLLEFKTALAVEQKAFQALEEQKAPIAERMAELESAISRRESEVNSYNERIEIAKSENINLIAQIEELNDLCESLKGELEKVINQRDERIKSVQDAENNLSETRSKIAKLNEQKGQEEVKMTQIDLRVESLCSTIRQRYNVNLEHFSPDSHKLLCAIDDQKKARQIREKRKAARNDNISDLNNDSDVNKLDQNSIEDDIESVIDQGNQPDWSFVELVIDELKQKLDSMGPVNIDAIEEFESLQERYDFLNKEHTDLVNAKDGLLKVISKINRETRSRFSDTFEQISKNFSSVFKELFGDQGRASLVMLDESDPLESGIDIIAKPPGKKPQSITLLSGGERAMTAVALLFSIYMVKPSPFCVLDELDAPLDEANIGRFLKLLDQFTKESQFVIVTHNKRTMSRCEVMYGVTQEEFGISQLIGMKFKENEKISAGSTNS